MKVWGRSAWGSASVHAAFFLRIGVQAATFGVLAARLPVEEFGRFAIVSAAAVVALPWAFGGGEIVLTRLVAQGRVTKSALQRLAVIGAGCAVGVATIAALVGRELAGGSTMTVALYFGAELIVLPIALVGAQVALADDCRRWFAALMCIPFVVRLAAALLVVAAGAPSLRAYASFEALLAGPVVLCAFALETAPRLRRSVAASVGAEPPIRLREGLSYAVGLSARAVYGDADKLVLAQALGPVATATYTVAYRLLAFAQAPAQALAAMYFPRFFRSSESIEGAVRLMHRLRRISLASGICGCLGMIVAVNLLVPHVFPAYRASVGYGSVLAVVPLINSATGVYADLVTSLGGQWRRVTVQVAAAAINPPVTWLLVSRSGLGISGAVASTLGTEVVLLVGLWWQARRIVAERRGVIANG